MAINWMRQTLKRWLLILLSLIVMVVTVGVMTKISGVSIPIHEPFRYGRLFGVHKIAWAAIQKPHGLALLIAVIGVCSFAVYEGKRGRMLISWLALYAAFILAIALLIVGSSGI